jgi:hypothetical protein
MDGCDPFSAFLNVLPCVAHSLIAVFSAFSLYCAVPCAMYLHGSLPLFELLVVFPFISYRLTGQYVLCSVLQKRFCGYDIVLGLWLLALAWAHFVMEPVPLFNFYSKLIPMIGFDPLPSLTLQQLLPWIIAAHTFQRNLADVAAHSGLFWPAAAN